MTKKKYIHFVIMIALTLIIAVMPPIGGITPLGMRTIGVFVGVLYGWIAFDLIIPSVYGYAALAVMGVLPTAQAMTVGFGNNTLVVVMVALVFAGAISSVGVTEVVTNWLLCRKVLEEFPGYWL